MSDIQFDGFTLDPEVRKLQEVTVTPKAGAQMLARFASVPIDDDGVPTNRDRRDFRVDNYARDMAAGKWFDTGDTIKISTDGALRDGQHRLEAVVRADVPINFFVFTGMEAKAQQGVDIGAGRTAADHARLRGMKNYTRITAIGRRALAWELGKKGYVGGSRRLPTVAEILDWIDANPSIYRAADVAAQSHRRRLAMAPAALGAAYYICSTVDARSGTDTGSVFAAEEFFVKQLLELENLAPGSAARALRFRLEDAANRSTGGRPMHADAAFRYTLLAWNHFRDGTFLTKLQAPKGGWTTANTPEPK